MSDRESALPFDESLGYLVRDLNRRIQRNLQARIQPSGATLGAWYFLRVLWEEESLTQRELAQRIGMQEPTAVIALRGMEEAGWIIRDRSEEDRRKVHIRLTDAGRALRGTLLPEAKAVISQALGGMSAAEVDTLLDLLRRARANLAEPPIAPGAPRRRRRTG
ncbi:MarR family winged helix-turn-helix transcriptional regulator [Falsiroseomonas sp.]|uniref:MarR family winged helix-turn-helix transcriptional regulator n=1 Tax=Falsiroseomonas sp. TaxID=2870721 RepID=UPI0027222B47|nr:MarR family transcriptional regulator [Falsiroseomonas sp.]MDO9498669.1 MarR family transcriptional regulator [Falsiroseomonas sp.]MDP3415766.1 MarR family transcriptional regulator [Falsiroseomonas sp.]